MGIRVTVLGRLKDGVVRGKEQPIIIVENVVTHGEIADRSHELYFTGSGGAQEENWLKAEDALLGLPNINI